jgi:glutathione synthase/RimK-type ligase-like ATP-grasp enzyme
VDYVTLFDVASGRESADLLIDRSLPPYDLPNVSWTGAWWNRPDYAWNAWSKSYSAAFLRAGLPHPKTAAFEPLTGRLDPTSEYVPAAARARHLWDYLGGESVVVKPDRGMMGNGVTRADSPDALARAMEHLRFGVVQSLIPEATSTIRVVCTASDVFAACDRVAAPGDFRANAVLGATVTRRRISSLDPIGSLACATVRALCLDMAGVDIVETSNGPIVLEANPAFGWPAVLADLFPDALDKMMRALNTPPCPCGDNQPHDASACE